MYPTVGSVFGPFITLSYVTYVYLIRTEGWKNIPKGKVSSLYGNVKITKSFFSLPELT